MTKQRCRRWAGWVIGLVALVTLSMAFDAGTTSAQPADFSTAVADADAAILDARAAMDEARHLGTTALGEAAAARSYAESALEAAKDCDRERFNRLRAEVSQRIGPGSSLDRTAKAVGVARDKTVTAFNAIQAAKAASGGTDAEAAETRRLDSQLEYEINEDLGQAERTYEEAKAKADEAAEILRQAQVALERCSLGLKLDAPALFVGETARVCYTVAGPGKVTIVISGDFWWQEIFSGQIDWSAGCVTAEMIVPPGQYTISIQFTSEAGTSSLEIAVPVYQYISPYPVSIAGPPAPTPSPSPQPLSPQTGGCRPATMGQPRVTLSQSSGRPGTMVTVTGNGFAANSSVMLEFTTETGNRQPAGEAMTDASGAFRTTVRVPAVTPGPHVVRVTDCAGSRTTAPFTILP